MEHDQTVSRGVRLIMLVWVLLAAVAVVYGVTNEQGDLESKSRSALVAAGLEVDDVRFEGRDAVVVAHPDRIDRIRAEQVLLDIDGVRAVVWDTPVFAAPIPSDAGSGSAARAGAGDQPVGNAVPTPTPAPTSTSTTTPAATVVTDGPFLNASLSQGQLSISGTVPDEVSAQRIGAVVNAIYAPFVVNDLTVDAARGEAEWAPTIATAVASLAIAGDAQLTVVNNVATLTGSTGSEAKKVAVARAVQAAVGDGVPLVNQIVVTGQVPPTYHAKGAPDGSVTLVGAMPDQQAIDTIFGAAARIYGPDNVTNGLVIGDNVEATFSVFRIPLTFTLLQPLDEWSIDIENDVISGAFLGGATFEYGSDRLTPELRALLDTAAGIVLRNPTTVLVIEGHTDADGPADFNQRLSEARAQAAVEYLIPAGIDPRRLIAVGYGESRPIASNDSAEGRAKNRRVQFLFGPPQGG